MGTTSLCLLETQSGLDNLLVPEKCQRYAPPFELWRNTPSCFLQTTPKSRPPQGPTDATGGCSRSGLFEKCQIIFYTTSFPLSV
mmetsp:Transcript_14502/g.40220  ORF Transcript_14502/g.40220 Transcript_14502/m.40220 type:complete len:84 (+) Transcript_14502:765-1016(+)